MIPSCDRDIVAFNREHRMLTPRAGLARRACSSAKIEGERSRLHLDIRVAGWGSRRVASYAVCTSRFRSASKFSPRGEHIYAASLISSGNNLGKFKIESEPACRETGLGRQTERSDVGTGDTTKAGRSGRDLDC